MGRVSTRMALPVRRCSASNIGTSHGSKNEMATPGRPMRPRSEEHTSELQSRQYLVCRLLLEKQKELESDLYATNGELSDSSYRSQFISSMVMPIMILHMTNHHSCLSVVCRLRLTKSPISTCG